MTVCRSVWKSRWPEESLVHSHPPFFQSLLGKPEFGADTRELFAQADKLLQLFDDTQPLSHFFNIIK